uniref:Uncharacterized protein n=1 Tax=Fagus sylvatica TaxID=28930 RepID=A0A2N9E840_FAGSY
MTPWHKEHSDGLCSQDHILRTQARLCARPVPLKSRVFLTRNKLIRKPGCTLERRHTHARRGTLGSPRILPPVPRKISGKSLGLESGTFRQRKLSDGTKNVEIRHRELESFPARNKLIREPGCVGKITTPATTWNSRFAGSIPRLTGIFAGKVHEKSSDTPTSGSHNFFPPNSDSMQNFISLESRTSRSFPTICCMTHFELPEDLQNCPSKIGSKNYAHGADDHARRAMISAPRGVQIRL